MQALYRLGEAAVSEVRARMPDRPSYNSVRVTLGILERKGHVQHRKEGRRYVYSPTTPLAEASESAVRSLLTTFFRGSPSKAILTMLEMSDSRLSREELEEISDRIRRARESK
jgi:predicted transcriptional regulator